MKSGPVLFTVGADNIDSFGALIRAMRRTLVGYWRDAEGYQKFGYLVAAVLIASGVFHTGVFLIDNRPWTGPLSWRKAISFGFSFGITTLCLTWVMSFLPRRRSLNWLLMGALGIAVLAEVSLVTMQAWRGVPSHFNFATPFDAAVFFWMGATIGVVGIVVIVITLWSLFSLRAPRSMAWAIRSGLILLLAGQAVGGLMIASGNAKVLDRATGEFLAERVAGASIMSPQGQLKVPHAVSIHGLQVLPLLAWLLMFTRYDEARRTRITQLGVLGYLGLGAVSAAQAFGGSALADLTPGTALVLSGSVLALVAAYAWALLALLQTMARGQRAGV